MPNSVAITNTDHTAEGLKALAGRCKDKNQPRRLAGDRQGDGGRARPHGDRSAGLRLLVFPGRGENRAEGHAGTGLGLSSVHS